MAKNERLESSKKYVEVTRKNNTLARTENLHIFKQNTPGATDNRQKPAEVEANPPFTSFNSEKKFYPNIETKNSNSHCLPREIEPSITRTRMEQATRLPS